MIVLAAAAHPDDIEFMMSGTLLHLRDAGARIHCLNVANGCQGTEDHGREEIVSIRLREARRAAELLGAEHHPPLVNDLEVFYDSHLIRRLGALVRTIRPDILLLQSPNDYMEDHMNTARLMVTAAFSRSMVNFETIPPREPWKGDMAVYHAMPYGLRGALREEINPHFFVDVAGKASAKRALLECHASQQQWLAGSQGLSDYVRTMMAMDEEMGRRSSRFAMAEGWRRHSHLGFASVGFDPLKDLLPQEIIKEGMD